MAPYIAQEDEPDMIAWQLFQEHMNTLEQEQYDNECEEEALWPAGDDVYEM